MPVPVAPSDVFNTFANFFALYIFEVQVSVAIRQYIVSLEDKGIIAYFLKFQIISLIKSCLCSTEGALSTHLPIFKQLRHRSTNAVRYCISPPCRSQQM